MSQNHKSFSQSKGVPPNQSPAASYPTNYPKSNTSISRHIDISASSFFRDRPIGLPSKPRFPQGASHPNYDQPSNSISSLNTRTPPSAELQPSLYFSQPDLRGADTSISMASASNSSPKMGTMKPARNSRPRETDEWSLKEHDKFCDLMMRQWGAALGVSAPYRQKADTMFTAISKLMASSGFERDDHDCYMHWYYVCRDLTHFKNTFDFPTPPARINEKIPQIVEDEPKRRSSDRFLTSEDPNVRWRSERSYDNSYWPNPPAGIGNIQIWVPVDLVSDIVGRRGDAIIDLEKSFGCHIKIARREEADNGLCAFDFYGTLGATSEARCRVVTMLNKFYTEHDFVVPGHLVPRIIGPRGSTIRRIEETSGCRRISTGATVDGHCSVRFFGSQAARSQARSLIMKMCGIKNAVSPDDIDTAIEKAGPRTLSSERIPKQREIAEENTTSTSNHTTLQQRLDGVQSHIDEQGVPSMKSVSAQRRAAKSRQKAVEVVNALNLGSNANSTQVLQQDSNSKSMTDSDSNSVIIKHTQGKSSYPQPAPRSSSQEEPRHSDDPVSPPSRSTTHTKPDNSPVARPLDRHGWTLHEVKKLHDAVAERIRIESSKRWAGDKLSLSDDQFWVYISSRVTQAGFKRSSESCRAEWQKTFYSSGGLVVQRLDDMREESENDGPNVVVANFDPGASTEEYELPKNGEWSDEEMWEVNALLVQYKQVSFEQRGPKQLLNHGLTWEAITQIHNDSGRSRSTNSLMRMWWAVREGRLSMPKRSQHMAPKRSIAADDENDNGEGSSKQVKRARPRQEEQYAKQGLQRQDFEDKIRKLQQDVADIAEKKRAVEKAMMVSAEKVAQLELEKQAELIAKNKYESQSAEYGAEIEEAEMKVASMRTSMSMFFNDLNN